MTTGELRASGADRPQLARLVAAGELTRLRRGVYALHAHDPEVARAVAAGGALTCVSALEKFGVSVLDSDATHVRVGQGATLPKRPGLVPHRLEGAGVGATRVDSIETALGVAVRCLGAEAALVAAESVINGGRLSEDEVQSISARGSREVRRIMRWLDGRSMSVTETLVRVRLQRLGYDVVPQAQVAGVGQVDLLVNRVHIIECDSVRFHTSLSQYAEDRRRDLEAPPRGYTRTRLTFEQVVDTWPVTMERLRSVFDGSADRARRRRAGRPHGAA